MNILFISDVHANLEALMRLESQIAEADYVICLGDLVGYGCFVNETIEFLRNHNICCIQGNHERYLIEGLEVQSKIINDSVRFGIEYAQKVLRADNYEWLKSLPFFIKETIDGLSLLICHGSPFDYLNGYVYENNTDFSKLEQLGYDLIVLGHTHRQMCKKVNNTLVLNPGSVGQARDFEGQVCAAVLNTQTLNVRQLRLDYNYMNNLSYSVACGAGEWIFKHYQTVLEKYDTI